VRQTSPPATIGALSKRLSRAVPLAVCLLAGPLPASTQTTTPSPIDLLGQARAAYALRPRPGAAARSVDLFEQAIAAGAGYEALWEGARASHSVAESGLPASAAPGDRARWFDKGIAWARAAIALQPARPEGHLFYVVNLGDKVDRGSFWQQLRAAGEIHREAELAVKYGAEVECGLPLTVLGLYLVRAPGVFGGDRERGLDLLHRAVRVCPDDVQNHLDLAEGLEIAGQGAKAVVEFDWVLAHEPDAPADRADYVRQRSEAERHLAALRRR
jgi:hypothetical protein